MEDIGINPIVARNILVQEIEMLKNTRYQYQVRHRVNKKIGATTEQLATLVTELERIEQMIDEYTAELNKLE